MDQKFMDMAIELAAQNVREKGKPFGAIIVKDGKIIAKGVNDAVKNNDPTAHAEIQAVRAASKDQKNSKQSLNGAIMYASGHPCPMCLAAMHLTNFEKIYYHSPLEDMEGTTLDVQHIYKELSKPFSEQSIPLIKMGSHSTENPVTEWLEINKND